MSLFTKTFTGWRKATARTAPGILLGVLLGAMALAARPAMAEPPTVFAAASLTDAMTAAGRAYEERTGTEIRFSFASSSTLARQIETGAPTSMPPPTKNGWTGWKRAASSSPAPERAPSRTGWC